MRLHRDAKTTLIASVPLFTRCSKHELADIVAIADEIDIPEGRVLIQEGELGRDFYVILDGTVAVEKDGAVVTTLGTGDYVGEIALLENSPRNATVTATTAVRALVVSGRAFWSLLDSAPALQRTLLETLAARLAPAAF
jgi:CRP-like cAMP-binding protein